MLTGSRQAWRCVLIPRSHHLIGKLPNFEKIFRGLIFCDELGWFGGQDRDTYLSAARADSTLVLGLCTSVHQHYTA